MLRVLFVLDVKDPTAVEQCVKSIMKPYIYRKNKEYYECTIKKLREIIIMCSTLIKKEYGTGKKCSSMYQSNITKIEDRTNCMNDDDVITIKIFVGKHENQQMGGLDINSDSESQFYERKYLKYKIKYFIESGKNITYSSG